MDWSDAPIVFLTGKSCPHCGGRKFIHCWTDANGDGSRTQRQICKRCSRRVLFVIEFPPSGENRRRPSIESTE
jgi:hypothetical protein